MVTAHKIVQYCYVVHNLEEGCARFHRLLGIGPFVGGAEIELADHRYRGQPAEPIRLHGVFIESGDLNIELVEILSAGPSAFHDMFANGNEGLHHCAVFSDDYVTERERWVAQDLFVASEFSTGFGAQLGHFIEPYPEHPMIRAIYAQTVEVPLHGTGRHLILPWR